MSKQEIDKLREEVRKLRNELIILADRVAALEGSNQVFEIAPPPSRLYPPGYNFTCSPRNFTGIGGPYE